MPRDLEQLKPRRHCLWATYGTDRSPPAALEALAELLERIEASVEQRGERQLVATVSGFQAKMMGIFKTAPLGMPLLFAIDAEERDGRTRVRLRVNENYGFQMLLGPARRAFEEKYTKAFELIDAEVREALGAERIADPPEWLALQRAARVEETSDRTRLTCAFLFAAVTFGGLMTLLFGFTEGEWAFGIPAGICSGVVFAVLLLFMMAKRVRKDELIGLQVDAIAQFPGKHDPKGSKRDVHDAIGEGLGEGEQADAARRTLDGRKRLLRRSKIGGWAIVAPVMVCIIGGVFALGGKAASSLVAFLGVAFFLYRVVSASFLTQPRIVLVLRRFGLYDAAKRVMPEFLSDVCRGLAVPITIQDRSFKGELSLGLQAFLRYAAPPLSLAIAAVLLFPFASTFEESPGPFVAVAIGTVLGCYGLLHLVARRVSVYGAREGNWERVVGGLIERIRAGRGIYSGTRVMTFPDSHWKQAIQMCLSNADAVVLDVTDISENVQWEIRQTFEHMPPERVIVVWAFSLEDETIAMPPRTRALLERLVGADTLARSVQRSYPEAKAFFPVLLEQLFAGDLAMCFSAPRPERAPAT